MSKRKQRPEYRPYVTVLGALLGASGLRVDYVADRVGLSPSYVSGIASGTRLPSEASLARIAAFFGVLHPLALLRPVSSADVCSALRLYLLGE